MVEIAPVAWLHFLNLPGTRAEMVDADLAAITTDADRVIQVTAPTRYIVHLEFQMGGEGKVLAERLLRYNDKLGLPPQQFSRAKRGGSADAQSRQPRTFTGRITRNKPDGRPYL